jgi:catechol-2,3-dioxygenase
VTGRLGRVHVRVNDLDAAERFYTRVLGLRRTYRGRHVVHLTSNDSRELTLQTHDVGRSAPPDSLGCRFIGFEVPSKTALVTVCERLGGARAVIVDTGDSWSVHTTDPAGNGVEIYCDTREDLLAPHVPRTLSLTELRNAAHDPDGGRRT